MNLETLVVGAVLFKTRGSRTFEDFEAKVMEFVDKAAEHQVKLMVFPELLTFDIVAGAKISRTREMLEHIEKCREKYVKMFSDASSRHSMIILGGSTVEKRGDAFFNSAHLFLPDGRFFTYHKIHLHYLDKVLGIRPGFAPLSVKTDIGHIGIVICYDVGFPELLRLLALEGAYIFLVPSAAPGRSAYLWLRYCCHARAIENQAIVVHSCLTGEVGGVSFNGKAAIFTSTDFHSDGVIIESDWDKNDLIVAEINMERFMKVRRKTLAPTLKDLRPDVYVKLCEIGWRMKEDE